MSPCGQHRFSASKEIKRENVNSIGSALGQHLNKKNQNTKFINPPCAWQKM
jgi:hypothetical protein